jgi:hypothetical protein
MFLFDPELNDDSLIPLSGFEASDKKIADFSAPTMLKSSLHKGNFVKSRTDDMVIDQGAVPSSAASTPKSQSFKPVLKTKFPLFLDPELWHSQLQGLDPDWNDRSESELLLVLFYKCGGVWPVIHERFIAIRNGGSSAPYAQNSGLNSPVAHSSALGFRTVSSLKARFVKLLNKLMDIGRMERTPLFNPNFTSSLADFDLKRRQFLEIDSLRDLSAIENNNKIQREILKNYKKEKVSARKNSFNFQSTSSLTYGVLSASSCPGYSTYETFLTSPEGPSILESLGLNPYAQVNTINACRLRSSIAKMLLLLSGLKEVKEKRTTDSAKTQPSLSLPTLPSQQGVNSNTGGGSTASVKIKLGSTGTTISSNLNKKRKSDE